jgi:hypothetical protein
MTEQTKPKRQAFSINIPDEKKEKIAKVAREANRPISWLVLDMFDRMIAANSINIYGDNSSIPPTLPVNEEVKALSQKLVAIEQRLEAIEGDLRLEKPDGTQPRARDVPKAVASR